MKAITDLLLTFELEYQDQPDALESYLNSLKQKGVQIDLELGQGLIAIDAERKLRSGELPKLNHYLLHFPAITQKDVESVLLLTLQQHTSSFCPVRSIAGDFPCEINGVRFTAKLAEARRQSSTRRRRSA